MLNVLRRLEDGLVQVLRMVLLVFSLLLLVGMAVWVWDYFKPSKPVSAVAADAVTLNWKDAKLDLGYVVDETRRDLGNAGNDLPMEKRLADPELRPSFQKADALFRGFIYMNPAQRKRIESDNNSQGLAPVHALLKGDVLPTPEEVNRQIKQRESRENGECCSADPTEAADGAIDAAHVRMMAESAARAGAVAAASAVAVMDESEGEAETDESLIEPIDVAASIHERAAMAQIEHGTGAYEAYVKGLPGALEKVLGNEDLAPTLRNQSAQGLISMVLINYTLAFDRTAMTLKGEEPTSSSWVERFQSVELAFWSLFMSFLVLVVMVLIFIRIERHLKVMSQQARTKD